MINYQSIIPDVKNFKMQYANKQSGGWRAYTFEELCKVKGYKAAMQLAKDYMMYDFSEYYNSNLVEDTVKWFGNGWLMTIHVDGKKYRCICNEKGIILRCIDRPSMDGQNFHFKGIYKEFGSVGNDVSFDQRKIVI